MLLHGSCHCQAVRFTVEAPHPYPYNLCYCTICRKTAGAGGYAINIGAENATLKIEGKDNIGSYQARLENGELSPAERKFCKVCATALWVWDSRWPELLHPHASAIDTELPTPPEKTHLMLSAKAPWVQPCVGARDKEFEQYPDESIAAWHERLGLG